MSHVDLTASDGRCVNWGAIRRRLGLSSTVEQVQRGEYAIQCSVPSLVLKIDSIEFTEGDTARTLQTSRTLLSCILSDETGTIVGNIETSLVTRTHSLEEGDIIRIEPVPLLTVNNQPTIFIVQSKIRGIIKHNDDMADVTSQQTNVRSQVISPVNDPSSQQQYVSQARQVFESQRPHHQIPLQPSSQSEQPARPTSATTHSDMFSSKMADIAALELDDFDM